MDYNTQRKKLPLPEYGRNVQKLVDYIKTIKNRNERTKAAKDLIAVMGNLNQSLRDVADFKHKLWDHLYIMADFDLDIDTPYPPPSREILFEKPDSIPYPDRQIRFKHYGRVLENLIRKAGDYPQGTEKRKLATLIANHMKKSYLMWNREAVNDEAILHDLRELSNGRLYIDSSTRLTNAKELNSKIKKKGKSSSSQNSKRG